MWIELQADGDTKVLLNFDMVQQVTPLANGCLLHFADGRRLEIRTGYADLRAKVSARTF